MGLLNDVKKAAEVKAPEVAAKADSKAERKAKAKERKAAKLEALGKIVDYVKSLKDVPADITKALEAVTSKSTGGQNPFGPSKLVQIFGSDHPEVGKTVSAFDVFTKVGLGYPEMRKYMKKWTEKGINVELDAKSQSYVVKAYTEAK